MKLTTFAFLACNALSLGAFAQNTSRRCGNELINQHLSATQPVAWQARQQKLADDQQLAMQQAVAGAFSKTAAQYPIPVAFHIVVTANQYRVMGNDTGVIRRVNSQLAVLNADYSATNADINLVPTPFVPLIGNTGLSFRLASGTSANTIAPGIEVRTIPASTSFTMNDVYMGAKRYSQGGLDAWDPTKQLNVWVIATDNGILGLCIPPQLVGYNLGGGTLTTADLGVVVSYGAFGSRDFRSQYFSPSTNDKGRTLTHEIGHYFELEHTWMDSGCGNDDGIADTPPQDDNTYCTPNCPTFPQYDQCSPTGNGIMFMNYMDYVDDAAMMLFTKGQVARMQYYTSPGRESYSLTQQVPQGVSTPAAPEGRLVSVIPNPNSGNFRVLNNSSQPLSGLTVVDMTGRAVYQSPTAIPAQETQPIALPALSKGIYFLSGTLGGETFTQKIVLQ